MKSKIKVENIFSVPDDRQVIITAGEMKRNFEREYNARAEEMFEQIKRDVVAQLMATCLTALKINFGFGKKRLQKFKSDVESLFIAMSRGGIMGKEFSTQSCIDLMRDEYGIDVDARGIDNDRSNE